MSNQTADSAMPAAPPVSPAWLNIALAYFIAWTGVWLIVSPYGFPGRPEALNAIYPLAFLAMLAGPPLAALVNTATFTGRPGLRDLVRRVFRWRVPAANYALALLVVPTTLIAVLALASAVSPSYVPGLLAGGDAPTLIMLGIVLGLAAGWFEEIGWTGFATPRLLGRFGVMRTGLILGVIHGFWHLLIGYWGEGAHFGLLYIPYFLLLWVVGLVALRLLIVWLYARTNSVLVAQLAHASYTGSLMILWPVTTDPGEIIVWTGLFAATLLLVVLGIIRFSSAGGTDRQVRDGPNP